MCRATQGQKKRKNIDNVTQYVVNSHYGPERSSHPDRLDNGRTRKVYFVIVPVTAIVPKRDEFITVREQRRPGTRKHQPRKFVALRPRKENVTTKGNASFALEPVSRSQVQRRRRLKSGAFVEGRGSIFRF